MVHAVIHMLGRWRQRVQALGQSRLQHNRMCFQKPNKARSEGDGVGGGAERREREMRVRWKGDHTFKAS